MLSAVQTKLKTLRKNSYSYAILLISILSLSLTGCSGFVNGNSVNPNGPTTLTISGVQAATPTTTAFQVSWTTNMAANSAVDYGTSASYGSSTPTNSTMVTSHQVAVTSLAPGTLYHFRVRSTDASSDAVSSGDMTFATAGDTTAPTVSITSPAANATLAGSVIVTANATDNVGVASVQFKVDSANTGAAVTVSPYDYSLNTTTLSNGNHIITAVATDAAGNASTSAGVAVKVNNVAGTVPSITSLSPTSGVVGTSVTIAGTNFGATQGTSTVKFNGTTATPTSWSATSITAPVPSGATTGSVVVTVGGIASSGVTFTVPVPAPSITSLNPASGIVGTSVTIAGANFGATQGTNTVKFNGTTATATSWSATSIVAKVPTGATTGSAVVTVGGVASNGVTFTVTVAAQAPSITSLNPTTGVVGTSVTIAGANFGATQGTSTIKFNGTAATPTSWSATSIVAKVPTGATTGSVVVTVGGLASNGVSFTVTVAAQAPSITSLNPTTGAVGTSVTIAGANFGATQGTSTIKFNGTTATATSWSATSIVAKVPTGATTGNVVVTVGGLNSNAVSFTVTVAAQAPSITSLNPTTGVVGTSVTIVGANFGATQGTSTIKFNGTTATATSWSATSITASVPTGATTGSAVVTVGGVASNGVAFTVTVPAPSITSLNPTSGIVGTSVTIAGASFGATQGTSTVKFNGTTATATSWSATSIAAKVPTGATTGSVVVTVGGVASNGVNFTVTADTTAPTVPSGLTALAISSSQINLSWTASTDNVGVTGYNVFRGGTKIGTSPSNTYMDSGLSASTSYSYNVSAFDAAGNTSAQSAGASATTQAASSGGGIPAALGWFQIPSTTLSSVCPSGAGANCANVIAAWSGGAPDTSRNRLVVWGGGHTDYSGNEIYALDLNSLAMLRLTNPSAPIGTCVSANSDGTPNARHTYGGLAYISSTDELFAIGGSNACSVGWSTYDTWTYNFTSKVWTHLGDNMPGGPTCTVSQSCNPSPFGNGYGINCDYKSPVTGDATSDLVYCSDGIHLYTYNPHTKSWTTVGNGNVGDYHQSGVLDPGRGVYLMLGNGDNNSMSITGTNFKSLNMTNCGALASTQYPGLAYDPVQKLVVGWAGGNNVYLYNATTDSCTSVTYSNGPGSQQANGTFGRFRYFPSLGVFAVVNGWQENGYTLRLTSGSGGSTGPTISQIAVTGITTTGANISWTTDVSATTQVEYGTSTSYGTLTTLNSTLSTSHSQALTGLTIGTLFHYRVHSKNSAGIESISGDAVFSTNNTTDTTPPTVSLTSPAPGATVSSTITVSASASDNVGVASVQFMLDGANVGSPVTASPYQMSWNTTTATNTTHSLSAVAKDAAGNAATASAVTVTVSNSSNAAAAALQDFTARCTAPGVVFCQGFDDASGFQQNVNIYSNATYPGVFPVEDSSTGRSGTSLRIDVPPFQGPNSGKFDSGFSGISGANGTDVYFQVATRISPEMLTGFSNFGWPTWKNHGFFNGNTSCTGLMLVTGLHSSGVIPVGTGGGCSAVGLYTNSGNPPYLLQQGDYNCQYGSINSSTCFYWPTNTWITFYYHLKLGTLNSSGDFPGTVVEAWVSINGQPYKKWLNLTNFYFAGNGANAPFNHLELYPYMTGKDASQGGYPTAHVWYDELIVSTQPIVAPAVPPALP
jgi:hypothetical protein